MSFYCKNCNLPYDYCRCAAPLSIPVRRPPPTVVQVLAKRIKALDREERAELLRELERE